jgi:hypothetical protein
VLLDMMTACAYSETVFFECFRECFFHTFCIYDNLRYRFNALWCWIFVTVKLILKSGVETFSQKFSYSSKIYKQLRFSYCFHDQIRIYFMSFIVQISPFVHLFTLAIVSRWGASPLDPPPGLCPGPDGGLKRPQTRRHLLHSKNICPLVRKRRGHIFFEWNKCLCPDPSPQVVPTFHCIPGVPLPVII